MQSPPDSDRVRAPHTAVIHRADEPHDAAPFDIQPDHGHVVGVDEAETTLAKFDRHQEVRP